MYNKFKPTMNEVKDEVDMIMNYTNKGDHIPTVESNDQTFKDRIRMKCHQLLCKNALKMMIKELVFDAAEKLNFCPAKNRMSKHNSPQIMMMK